MATNLDEFSHILSTDSRSMPGQINEQRTLKRRQSWDHLLSSIVMKKNVQNRLLTRVDDLYCWSAGKELQSVVGLSWPPYQQRRHCPVVRPECLQDKRAAIYTEQYRHLCNNEEGRDDCITNALKIFNRHNDI